MNFPSFPSIRQPLNLRSILFLSAILYKSSLWAQGTVEISFFSKETGEPISARIEFTESVSRPPKPKGALVAGRQILVEKVAKLAPPIGKYEFIVRRGIEFSDVRTGFELEPNATNGFEVFVPHKTPMRDSRWYSGDLLSHLSTDLTARWMRADDLDIVATTFHSISSLSKKGPRADSQISAAIDSVQSSSIYLDKPGKLDC